MGKFFIGVASCETGRTPYIYVRKITKIDPETKTFSGIKFQCNHHPLLKQCLAKSARWTVILKGRNHDKEIENDIAHNTVMMYAPKLNRLGALPKPGQLKMFNVPWGPQHEEPEPRDDDPESESKNEDEDDPQESEESNGSFGEAE